MLPHPMYQADCSPVVLMYVVNGSLPAVVKCLQQAALPCMSY